ncbi:MAG: hypothetical protein A2W85_13665 [Bacteroidetes bacterium GWF2_41_31]|nr:MAG: hypothetical protein A2W85_13665 [Bacteroidetes bacterium GWF2_41_31]
MIKKMKKRTAFIILIVGFLTILLPLMLPAQNNLPYLGQEPPGMRAKQFAPDSLLATNNRWWHGSPVFSPDGLEMFWAEYVTYGPDDHRTTLFTMKVVEDNWSPIQHPSFAMPEYHENSPFFSVGGDTLYFVSTRPGGFFRMVTRTPTGWSESVTLQVPISPGMGVGWEIAVNRSGDIYLEISTEANPEPDIYVSRYQNGSYQMPQSLGDEVNSEYGDWGPYIDPDDQYLIFSSNRPGMIGQQFDLYISFRKADLTWAEPINMGYEVNSTGAFFPYVSLDKQYLFFNTARTGDMGYNPYWISAEIIDSLHTVVSIKEQKKPLGQLKYLQNSPNPCMAQTTINFELEKSACISLVIHNQFGQKVVDLIKNETYQTGKHEIIFDVSKLPSGCYTYTLILENGERLSQKMIVVQ